MPDVKQFDIDTFNTYAATKEAPLDNKTMKNVDLGGRWPELPQTHPGVFEDDFYRDKLPEHGVKLENMTISNLTMDRVKMDWAHFKNVTFRGCRFLEVDFSRAWFENVKFIDCDFTGNSLHRQTNLYKIKADNVLFDRVRFDQHVVSEYTRGTIILRNIYHAEGKEKYNCIISGENLNVLVDKCTIENAFAVAPETTNSTVYVKDSTLVGRGIAGVAKAVWVENSTIWGGVSDGLVTVVKNCKVQGAGVDGLGSGSKVFVVDCTFGDSGRASFRAKPEEIDGRADIYFYGNKKIPKLVIYGGNCHIFDTEIGELVILTRGQDDERSNIDSLNLKNVTIQKGDWESTFIRKGNWENVTVTGPVLLEKMPEAVVVGHNVEFKARPPFVYFDHKAMIQYLDARNLDENAVSKEMFYRPSEGNIKVKKSNTPLEFDQPPVPTLDELGFVDFWKKHDPAIAGW